MRRSPTSTRSTAPIVPPASPMAAATRASIPGRSAISTRRTTLYWAEGTAATGPRAYRAGAAASVEEVAETKVDGAVAGPQELFLIDGNSLAYRAFFALPESIATSTGFPTNAIFGFASMLVKILTEHGTKPTIVVWDAPGMSGRKEVYPEYKA